MKRKGEYAWMSVSTLTGCARGSDRSWATWSGLSVTARSERPLRRLAIRVAASGTALNSTRAKLGRSPQ